MTPLNTNDYKQILEYYKKPIPGSTRQMKIDAGVLKRLIKIMRRVLLEFAPELYLIEGDTLVVNLNVNECLQ